jgi:hypothetical protein
MAIEGGQREVANGSSWKNRYFGWETGTIGMPDIENLGQDEITTSSPAQMAMEGGERKLPMDAHGRGDILDGNCGHTFLNRYIIYSRIVNLPPNPPK